MKKKFFYLFGLGCSLLFLGACSTTNNKTETAGTVNSKKAEEKTITYKQSPALSKSFSIEVPEDWAPSFVSLSFLNTNMDSLSVKSADSLTILSATRLYKSDVALSLKDFAAYDLDHSDSNQALKDAEFNQATVAGKTGYLLQETITVDEKEDLVSVFFYEDGDFYKMISVEDFSLSKKDSQKHLEHAMQTWVDTPVTTDYLLQQSLTIPNTAMTVTIPHDWKQETLENSDQNSLFYSAPKGQKGVGIFSQSTAGYVLDLPGYVQQYSADVAENATFQEVTVGPHQGYRIQFTSVNETAWNMATNIYIFHINDTLVNFIFTTEVSQEEAFRPTMEAIITSLQ